MQTSNYFSTTSVSFCTCLIARCLKAAIEKLCRVWFMQCKLRSIGWRNCKAGALPLITVTAEYSILSSFVSESQRASLTVNVTVYLVSSHINTAVVSIIELDRQRAAIEYFIYLQEFFNHNLGFNFNRGIIHMFTHNEDDKNQENLYCLTFYLEFYYLHLLFKQKYSHFHLFTEDHLWSILKR